MRPGYKPTAAVQVGQCFLLKVGSARARRAYAQFREEKLKIWIRRMLLSIFTYPRDVHGEPEQSPALL